MPVPNDGQAGAAVAPYRHLGRGIEALAAVDQGVQVLPPLSRSAGTSPSTTFLDLPKHSVRSSTATRATTPSTEPQFHLEDAPALTPNLRVERRAGRT